MGRAGLDRRAGDHHHKFEQQSLEKIAPFLARAVNVNQNLVNDSYSLSAVTALDGRQQRRLLIQVKFANQVVRPMFEQRDGGKTRSWKDKVIDESILEPDLKIQFAVFHLRAQGFHLIKRRSIEQAPAAPRRVRCFPQRAPALRGTREAGRDRQRRVRR